MSMAMTLVELTMPGPSALPPPLVTVVDSKVLIDELMNSAIDGFRVSLAGLVVVMIDGVVLMLLTKILPQQNYYRLELFFSFLIFLLPS